MQASIPITEPTEIHQSDHECMHMSRLTVNRKVKKEQHACTSSGLRDHFSEHVFFTCTTASNAVPTPS